MVASTKKGPLLGAPLIRILVYYGQFWGPCLWKPPYTQKLRAEARKKPESLNISVLQPQSKEKGNTSIDHPTSIFQVFEVHCTSMSISISEPQAVRRKISQKPGARAAAPKPRGSGGSWQSGASRNLRAHKVGVRLLLEKCIVVCIIYICMYIYMCS